MSTLIIIVLVIVAIFVVYDICAPSDPTTSLAANCPVKVESPVASVVPVKTPVVKKPTKPAAKKPVKKTTK